MERSDFYELSERTNNKKYAYQKKSYAETACRNALYKRKNGFEVGNGTGLPDTGILDSIANALSISVSELFSGDIAVNKNLNSNLQNLCFYACPVCKNTVFSMGEGSFLCCGKRLERLCRREDDKSHGIRIEFAENEHYVSLEHEMSKEHYISMLCMVTNDRIQTVKLYPEQGACAVFGKFGHGMIYALCSNHGLFAKKI